MELLADGESKGTEAAESISSVPKTTRKPQDEVLAASVSGKILPLTKVKDPVFSTEMMGRGIAVKPDDGVVHAPADGILTVVHESKHAYGLKKRKEEVIDPYRYRYSESKRGRIHDTATIW